MGKRMEIIFIDCGLTKCLKVEAEYQWDDNFSSGYRKPGRDLAQSFQ